MPNKKLEEEVQKKYIHLQIIKQQLSAYVEEKTLLDKKIEGLTETIETLKKLGKIKSGEEIWSQIGSNSYVRSDIKDTQKVLVSVGAGIVVKEKRAAAIELLKKQLDEMKNVDENIISEIMKLNSESEKLETELQEMVNKMEKQQGN